ncbi:transposable element Tcb2 transposase [Trichonephila clavipes]|nr:transposable element Tcb2 transposase [Trichonephila clavipes]
MHPYERLKIWLPHRWISFFIQPNNNTSISAGYIVDEVDICQLGVRITIHVHHMLSMSEMRKSHAPTLRTHTAYLGSRHPLRELHLTPTHRRLCWEWCRARGNWTAAEWNQVVFSDESRFNLSSDGNRVRMWRPRDERLNPAYGLQRHTASTVGVLVRGAIAYNTLLPPSIDPWRHDSPAVCP